MENIMGIGMMNGDFNVWETLVRIREQEANGLYLNKDIPVEDLKTVFDFYEIILKYEMMNKMINEISN